VHTQIWLIAPADTTAGHLNTNDQRSAETSNTTSTPETTTTTTTTTKTSDTITEDSEDKFFYISGCPMAIYSTSTQKLISTNPAMDKLLGFSKSDLTSKAKLELTPTDEEKLLKHFVKVVSFSLPDETTKYIVCNCTVESNKLYIVATDELPSPSPKLKILVVDDNSLQQKMMTVVLQKLGFNPDIAQNGKEAVLALEKQSYDLIFMDICMPVMNGWQATQEIKRKRTEHSPFIVAATSNTEDSDKKKCVEAGMDSFIPKPVQIEQVRAVLQQVKRAKLTHNS